MKFKVRFSLSSPFFMCLMPRLALKDWPLLKPVLFDALTNTILGQTSKRRMHPMIDCVFKLSKVKFTPRTKLIAQKAIIIFSQQQIKMMKKSLPKISRLLIAKQAQVQS